MKRYGLNRMLLAGLLASAPAWAAGTGVPLLYRSEATDLANSPAALVARDRTPDRPAARLTPSPSGRVTVSFDRAGEDAGRFVYLGFTFSATGPFAITVNPIRPVASVHVAVNGNDLQVVAGAQNDYATLARMSAPYSVVIRLERADAREVPVTVHLKAFETCPSLISAPCGTVKSEPPAGLVYDMSAGAGAEAPADVLVPAVVRAAGLHGPVRTDLSLANRTDATIKLTLTLHGVDGSQSAAAPLSLAPRSRRRVEDVVQLLYHEAVDTQGVLAIRGYVPLSPGDITAETYYDRGKDGRIGTSLPLFVGEAARVGATILASSTEGNPSLLLFSSAAPGGDQLVPHAARVNVQLAGGDFLSVPLTVYSGFYSSARLFDITGPREGDGLVSVDTDDPSLHAVLIRNDPGSGSPFVVASN